MRVVAVVVLLVGLLGAGCARPVTPEPFGEFSVSRSGGVAGVRDLLRVTPDGLAVVASPEPAAGRLSADRLAHVRRILESEDLAREARDAREDDGDDRCSDVFVRTVRMGSLAMSVTETCGSGGRRATPAFDELVALLAEAARGRFDEPLAAGDVPSLTVRVERPASGSTPASVVVLAPDGRAALTRPGEAARSVALPDAQRDALALTAAGLLGLAPTPCTGDPQPSVEVSTADGRRVRGSACGFGARALDAYALAGTLLRAVPR